MSKPLNAKQLLFIKEYPVDRNQTKAAIRAGYAEVSARQRGALLMANKNIRAEIEKAMVALDAKVEKRVDEVVYSKARWLNEVAAIAYADITDAFQPDEKGRLQMSLPDLKKSGFGRLIRKLKVMPNGKVEFEMHAKAPALELLAKAHADFISNKVAVEHSGIVTHAQAPVSEQDFKNVFANPQVAELALKIAELTSASPLLPPVPVAFPTEKEKKS